MLDTIILETEPLITPPVSPDSLTSHECKRFHHFPNGFLPDFCLLGSKSQPSPPLEPLPLILACLSSPAAPPQTSHLLPPRQMTSSPRRFLCFQLIKLPTHQTSWPWDPSGQKKKKNCPSTTPVPASKTLSEAAAANTDLMDSLQSTCMGLSF